MNVQPILNELVWMHIDGQIGYLFELNHDYQEFTNESLLRIIDHLEEITFQDQVDDLTELFGDRINITVGEKITIQLA